MKLPVLLYHHVGHPQPAIDPSLTVSPERFESQMGWLAQRGYIGIRPVEWLARVRQGRSLPERSVIVTFDDAYADLATFALPILHKHGFGAAVFVVSAQIGGKNVWDLQRGAGTAPLMTSEQIREWSDREIEFGSHGWTHTDLTKLPPEELEKEIVVSQRDLSGVLGQPVESFAYPYGHFNGCVQKRIEETYALAFSVEEGMNSPLTDLYRLRRTMVQPHDTLLEFACRVRYGWSPITYIRSKLRLRSRMMRAAGFSCGHSRYVP